MNKFDYFKSNVRWTLRKKHDKNMRNMLINTNPSIFSSNCVGGVIYHALGLQFESPTINLFFSAKDYLKFLQNPNKYLYGNFYNIKDDKSSYPIIGCDDIVINAVHYLDFQEFKTKWDERTKRINFDNLYVMMCERDGCSYDDIKTFDSLPYKNKVIFVHKPMPEFQSACFIPGTGLNQNGVCCVRDVTSYVSRFSTIRYIDYFDYVSFLNEGSIKLNLR